MVAHPPTARARPIARARRRRMRGDVSSSLPQGRRLTPVEGSFRAIAEFLTSGGPSGTLRSVQFNFTNRNYSALWPRIRNMPAQLWRGLTGSPLGLLDLPWICKGVRGKDGYRPPLLHRLFKPRITGNAINGLGER